MQVEIMVIQEEITHLYSFFLSLLCYKLMHMMMGFKV